MALDNRLSHAITIENLHYAYPPARAEDEPRFVLHGINLAIEAGSFVAIMGPTGAGKSTLCMALNGLVPQATGGVIRGDVHAAGLNTKRHPVAGLARHVGMVFQDPETQFFSMSVEAEVAFGLENLGTPRGEMLERIDWALELVGMGALRGRSPFELSGGEKQRVAIASVLAMRPGIVVLDEPTSNLDPRGKTQVFSAVRRLRDEQDATIVMVEHDSERVAEFADRLVVLDGGKVVLDAPPPEAFLELERLARYGVAAPSVSEIAGRLSRTLDRPFAFARLDPALSALKAALDERS